MSKVFYSSEPVLRWHAVERTWIVAESFSFRWHGDAWTIHAGFVTDFASIPRAFRSFIPQVGRHIQPAIVHDFFYRNPGVRRGLSRAKVDWMFLDGMNTTETPWRTRMKMYWGVRAGGWAAWKKA